MTPQDDTDVGTAEPVDAEVTGQPLREPNKIKSEERLRVAVRHNLREIEAELKTGGRIDATRVHRNYIVRPAICKVARPHRAMWVNADSQNSRSQLQ